MGDPFASRDHLEHRANRIGVGLANAVHLPVHQAFPHHHGPEDIGVLQLETGFGEFPPLALPHLEECFGESLHMRIAAMVHDGHPVQGDMQGFGLCTDRFGISQQQRMGDAFLDRMVGGPDNDRIIAFGQHDPFGILLGAEDDLAHDFPLRPQTGLQALHVSLPVRQGRPGHTAGHRGFGHGRHHLEQHAGIQGFGNDVLRSEADGVAPVSANDGIGHILAGPVRPGPGRPQFSWPR